MGTNIVYDGKLAERRAGLVEKLKQLVLRNKMVALEEDAEKHTAIKQEYVAFLQENEVQGNAYLDVLLGDYIYDVIVVGRYGMAIVGETDNPLFYDLSDVYELEEPGDLLNIKSSVLLSRQKQYTEFVNSNGRNCRVQDLISEMPEIDTTAFMSSELWKELDTRRLLLAEHYNVEPYMVYRVKDVVELLNLAPENPVLSVDIAPEYQKVIIKAWKNFLQ